MHIPDGFIDATTSLGAGVISIGGLSVALRKSREFLDEKRAPLAGLMAAFVFAAQMLNFPVAAGTSGHLLGGLLAAVLLGPWVAALVLAVVLVMQGVLFADGGLTALGLNVLNMAFIGTFAGWGIFVVFRKLLPSSRTGFLTATAIASGLSVVAAALGFALEYAIGGTGTAPVGTVTAAMVGVHTFIGIGEAVITVLTVGAVLSVRPDLVYGAGGAVGAAPLAAVGGAR